jgi:threonine dehydrogenase-like Zn-dependent dehydrogenase
VLGHEAVVTVNGRPGSFVVYPLISCGDCEACSRGDGNLCRHRGLLGLDRPGVFADSVLLAEDALIPLPQDIDPLVAVLTEPQAASVSVLRQEGVGAGTRLVVFGCGPIGLLAVHAAAQLGVSVVAADPVPLRREIALQLGAKQVVADGSELVAQSADLVIDAVGVETTWSKAIACARSGGAVVVLGLAQAEGVVPVGDLVRRGVSLRGHYAYTREDFEAALALLAEHPPPLHWLEFAMFGNGPESFRRIVDSPDEVIKVVLVTPLEAAERGEKKVTSANAPGGAQPGAAAFAPRP